MENSKGKLFGSILLVSGTCIGAGMLGLPVLTGIAGFIPSSLMFVFSWLYMLITGLFFLEVNLWFGDEVSFISMSERMLGRVGKIICWLCFLFLFYSLMVAYISGSASFVSALLGIDLISSSILATFFFGAFFYFGTAIVDRLNRVLVAGILISYFLLVVTGIPYVNVELLEYKNWSLVPLAVPTMIVSFGFHNLIPTLTTYLNHEKKQLKWVLIIGSALPLFLYILWEGLILGLVDIDVIFESLKEGDMATKALRRTANSTSVITIAESFAFFAIVTSFLGVGLSLIDFLSDGLRLKKEGYSQLILCALALIPPLVFSITNPNVFLKALGAAGGFGAVLLFGIIPSIMVAIGRYHNQVQAQPLVRGGLLTIVMIILASLFVMSIQLNQMFNG